MENSRESSPVASMYRLSTSAVSALTIALLSLQAGLVEADGFLDRCKFLKKSCEAHNITTVDGCRLTVHRIKGGKTPVLFVPGLLSTSEICLVKELNSTCIALSDAGYDVFVANVRGTKYGLSTKPQCSRDYSFHEMGLYDLSRTIDFVLERTGYNKTSIIGHSQGCTIWYVLASLEPIYNQRVKISISLAPAAPLFNPKGIINSLAPLWPTVYNTLSSLGVHAVFLKESAVTKAYRDLCTTSAFGNIICQLLTIPFSGREPDPLGPLIFAYQSFPSSVSTKTISHFVQLIVMERFAEYDYGTEDNLVRYGSPHPPEYDLSEVTSPSIIACGSIDLTVSLEDCDILRKGLANVEHYEVLEYTHMNFVMARDLNEVLNPKILKWLRLAEA